MGRIPDMPLGPRIRLARTSLGWDAKELGDKLGLTPSAVTSWERGRSQPSLERIEQLAQILDVDVVWLAFGRTAESVSTGRRSDVATASGGDAPDLPTMRDPDQPSLWEELVAA